MDRRVAGDQGIDYVGHLGRVGGGGFGGHLPDIGFNLIRHPRPGREL